MFGKALLKALSLLCASLLAGLGIAFVFRDALLKMAASSLLADKQLQLAHVQGVQVGLHRSSARELELVLSYGRLVVRDLVINYRFESPLGGAKIESVEVASIQLLPGDSSSTVRGNAPQSTNEEPMLLSEVLALLREFRVARIAVVSLSIPQRREPFLVDLQSSSGALTLRMASGELRLESRFTQTDAAAPASLHAALAHGDAVVGTLDLLLQPQQRSFVLNGTGRLDIADLNTLFDALEQAPLALPLQATTMAWDLAGTVADDVAGTFAASGNGTADTSGAATFVVGMQSGSTVTLSAGAVSGLGTLTLGFSDRAEISVATGSAPAIRSGVLPLLVNGSWQEQPLHVDTRITLTECRPDTYACVMRFDGTASFATYSLSGQIEAVAPARTGAADQAVAYQLHSTGLVWDGLPSPIPPFDLAVDFVLDQNALSFTTPVLLRDAPADVSMTVDGSYDLDTGAASMQLKVPALEFGEGHTLSAWFSEWPYSFDVLSGSLSADLALQWQPAADTAAGEGRLTGSISSSLRDLAGSYDDIFFRGASGALQGSFDTSSDFPLDTPPLALTITGIDVGVPLENIALDFRVERATQRVLINKVSAQLLGGSVSGTDMSYGFSRERNDLTLRFDGLRLERMLALAEYEGVEAVGAVSGLVPIVITPEGVEVTAGTLQADAPGGSIRYLAGAAGAQGNAGLDLVHQALGNYQFDSLVSDIDYSADGELLLAMKMQGFNPDMNNGQRINLNLNLSDNIPALLQSLQAARAIEDFLQQRYETEPQ